MFPGGEGANHFQVKKGQIKLGINFLVRTSPDFVARGLAAAIVDVPSDQSWGMSDAFRTSHKHELDIRAVIDFLSDQGLNPIFLVGTSRGTLSVAYLGTILEDKRIEGMVLTSSLGGSRFLEGFPLNKIPYPVLIVHHLHDECKVSQFLGAKELISKFSQSPNVDFVEVQGGKSPQSGPCQPLSYHGFWGMEKPVVDVITNWIFGNPIPRKIVP